MQNLKQTLKVLYVNKYLRHLIMNDIFEIFTFLATALGFLLIAPKFISVSIFDYIIIGSIMFLFVVYRLYSTFYIDYADYKNEREKDKKELYGTYMVLLSLKDVVKDRKIKKALAKSINIIKKDIDNYKM